MNKTNQEICDDCARYLDRTFEKEIYELAKIVVTLTNYRPMPSNGFTEAPVFIERATNMMMAVEKERMHLKIIRLEKENFKLYKTLEAKDAQYLEVERDAYERGYHAGSHDFVYDNEYL